MNNKINKLHLSADGKTVGWESSGKDVRVSYTLPVFIEPFYDNSGVVVIEPMSTAPDNAVILDPDGNISVRISNPLSTHKLNSHGDLCFKDICYGENGVLLLISGFWYKDYWCLLGRDGQIFEFGETR